MKGDELFSLLPLGIFEVDGKKIARSSFGASWGGFVYKNMRLKYAEEMVEGLIEYLKKENVTELYITFPPVCYYQNYSNYFEFLLFQKNFISVKRELSSVLDLRINVAEPILNFDSSARTQVRKSEKAGIRVIHNVPMKDIYPLIDENRKRLGSTPTHTLEELEYLSHTLPASVLNTVAEFENKIIACNVCFISNNCAVSMYPSYDKNYGKLSPMNLLFYNTIEWCINNKLTFFDFGLLTWDMKIVNWGLVEFKESLGAKGYFRDTYHRVL